jgi:cyclin-C
MAANYWTSTQRRFWHFSPSQLVSIRSALTTQNTAAINQYPISDPRHILIFLKDQLLRLSRRLQSRQQCLATTLIYIHRYLLTHPLQTFNPYLLLTTAFYLASKTEESPHHIRVVLGEARQFWPEFVPGDVSRIGEMEFSLISEMRSQLIIWHPYRTLLELRGSEKEGGLELSNDEVGMAWSIINDSYLTDLPLTCAPHTIAVMAIFLAVAFQPTNKALAVGAGLPTFQIPSTPNLAISNNSSASFQGLGGRQGMSAVINSAMSSPVSGRPSASATADAKLKPNSKPAPSEKMQRIIRFLAESSIDLEQIIDATQQIVSLYEVWESYSEKAVKEALARVITGRGMDK